jgi:hypothetical protein
LSGRMEDTAILNPVSPYLPSRLSQTLRFVEHPA